MMTAANQTVRSAGSRRRTRAWAVVTAVAAAVAIWVVADPLLGQGLEVERWDGDGTTTVGLPQVVPAALFAALAAWTLLAILEKVTERASHIWTIIASVVLVVSLGGPATSSADAGTGISLILMHLAVGGVLIPTLSRS